MSTDNRIMFIVDDYEKIRGDALRTVRQQSQLLTDGLHALRHGAPHVTDEFLDRAITKLDRLATRLSEFQLSPEARTD